MTIEIRNIRKRFGSVTALDGPSFDIPGGSTFGVLGTNGAGKSTLFKLIVGHDVPDAGRIAIDGTEVNADGPRLRDRVGYLPERAGYPGEMTGREVLAVQARIRGLAEPDDGVTRVVTKVGLADAADRPVEGYSNGMQRRLGLAGALLPEPPVLVLDEPTAGLDPRGVAEFHRIVERIDRDRDRTVVLSSHVLGEIERLCDAIAILHEGRLRAVGSVDDLRAAVDDEVTITLWPEGDVNAVRSKIGQFGEVSVAVDRIAVTVPPEQTWAVLDAVEPTAVASVDVTTPGLEAVFHAAIEEEVSA